MKDFKFGFIGCGRHAQMCLYPSLESLGVKLQSVSALHKDHAEVIAKKYNIPNAYDNYKTMLVKEHLDGVFVAVSEAKHGDIVLDCLFAGAHVFVEKPLGSTVADAIRVADMSKKTGKYVQVGYMKRFSPVYQKAKAFMLDQKIFGTPVSMHGIFTCRNFGFGTDERNFILNAAIHNIDLIRYFAGEISEVRGYKKIVEEGISYQFSFKSDTNIIGTMSIMALPPWAHRKEEMTITGTKAFVTATDIKTVTFHPASEANSAPRWQMIEESESRFASMDSTSSGGLQPLYLTGFVGELQAFVESVKNNIATINTADENVKTMQLCEKILTSLK
jgi:predicted dehydrogenase